MNEMKVRVLDPVDFHGQALTVVDHGGQPYVAMRPIVEGMGLSWPAQYRKLTEESARFCVAMIATQVPGDDQVREITTIPLRKLTGWLMTLQPSRMDGVVAEKVLLYQNECDDALWDYWTKGVAINPRLQGPTNPTDLGLPDFNDPFVAAEAWAKEGRGRVAAEAQVKQLEAKVAADAPRVDFAATVERAEDTYLVGQLAKIIQQGTSVPMGQNRLFKWLRRQGYLHTGGKQHNLPTQVSVDGKWVAIQTRAIIVDEKPDVVHTPLITGKGLLYFYGHFYKMAIAMGHLALKQPPMTEIPRGGPAGQQLGLQLWVANPDDPEDEGSRIYPLAPEA